MHLDGAAQQVQYGQSACAVSNIAQCGTGCAAQVRSLAYCQVQCDAAQHRICSTADTERRRTDSCHSRHSTAAQRSIVCAWQAQVVDSVCMRQTRCQAQRAWCIGRRACACPQAQCLRMLNQQPSCSTVADSLRHSTGTWCLAAQHSADARCGVICWELLCATCKARQSAALNSAVVCHSVCFEVSFAALLPAATCW